VNADTFAAVYMYCLALVVGVPITIVVLYLGWCHRKDGDEFILTLSVFWLLAFFIGMVVGSHSFAKAIWEILQ
jgi:hypothetical protein